MANGDIRRWIQGAAILALGIVAAAYAADYVSFSFHFPASRTLLSTIEIKGLLSDAAQRRQPRGERRRP